MAEKEKSVLASLNGEQREALKAYIGLVRKLMDQEGLPYEKAVCDMRLSKPYEQMIPILYPKSRVLVGWYKGKTSFDIHSPVDQWLTATFKKEDLQLRETDARGDKSTVGRESSIYRPKNLRIKTYSLEEIAGFFGNNAWGQEADYDHFYSHGSFPDQELVKSLDNQQLIEKYLEWIDAHMNSADAVEKYLSGYALHCRFEMGRRFREGVEKFQRAGSLGTLTKIERKYAPNLKYQEFHFQRFSELWREEKNQELAFDRLVKEFPDDIRPTAFDSFVVQFRKWNKTQIQKRK